MIKKLTLQLPVHLKKFFLYEYDGYEVKRGEYPQWEIKVSKASELGKLIHLISRPIPFTQQRERTTGDNALTIIYTTREKIYEVPVEKVGLLIKQMDEIFRRTLISEVRAVHEVTGSDYSPYVVKSLERRGIRRDVDYDYETARKIYRDYVASLAKKNQKIFA